MINLEQGDSDSLCVYYSAAIPQSREQMIANWLFDGIVRSDE